MGELSGLQIFGLILAVGGPAVTWTWWISNKLNGINRKSDKLVELELQMAKAMREQSLATKQLVHYTKWSATQQNSGREPPPYIGD